MNLGPETAPAAEGLDGCVLAEYIRLAKDCRNNLRAMLSVVEAGEMLS